MPRKKSNSTKKSRSSVKDYLIDCSKNNMLYGSIVRSPVAFGKIKNILPPELPENYFLYTARDIPGKNEFSLLSTKTNVFCTDEVHFLGEAVGIVVGEDIKLVRKLASEVQITFDNSTLEMVAEDISRKYNSREQGLGIRDKDESEAGEQLVDEKASDFRLQASDFSIARRDFSSQDEQLTVDTGQLTVDSGQGTVTGAEQGAVAPAEAGQTGEDSDDIADNSNDESKTTTATDDATNTTATKNADDATTAADEAIEVLDSYHSVKKMPKWLEKNGALAYSDGGGVVVLSPTKMMGQLQKEIACVLGMSDEKIEVRQTLSRGKDFFGSWETNILACQASVAAILSEHPVKLLLSEEENEKYFSNQLPSDVKFHSWVSKTGKIININAEIAIDVGFCNPYAQEIADRLSIAAMSFYYVENFNVSVVVNSSKTMPTSLPPETLDADVIFALENHLNHIAREISVLPDELRLQNIDNEKSKIKSKSLASRQNASSFDSRKQTMEIATKESDFFRKYSSFNMKNAESENDEMRIWSSLPKRGIGLSCAFEGSYFFGSENLNTTQKMQVTLELDGQVTINCFVPSLSVSEIWKKIVSEILQIETSKVQITANDSENADADSSEKDSSNISLMTTLLKRACQEIQKKRFFAPLPITAKKMPSPTMKRLWNETDFSGQPFYSTSFGSAVVEVETNPYTDKQKITGVWVAIDCGEILLQKAAESTVRLAISQELQTLTEDENLICDNINIFFVPSTNPPCQIGTLIHNLLKGAFLSAEV